MPGEALPQTDEEADRRLNLRGTLKLQGLEPRFTDFPLRGTEKFLRIEACVGDTFGQLEWRRRVSAKT